MRLSRRRFLALAGTTAAGAAVGGYLGSLASPPPTTETFRSRPDLTVPLIDVTTADPPLGSGYVFVTPAGPMIVDDAGSPVWLHPVRGATTNLQVQRYRGEPVLTWWQGSITHYGTGKGVGIIMSPSYQEVARVGGANGVSADLHELRLTEQGSAYLTAFQLGEADLRPVGGPRRGQVTHAMVQEVEVASGNLLFEWRADEHLSFEESYATYSGSQPYDPVHLNSIQLLPDGNLLLSARNTWALYKVDRQTGDIIWRLGGKRSDFSLGEGVRFAWQHDARAHPDGTVSLFDDEGDPPEATESRALLLAVDEERRRVTLERSYTHRTGPLLAGSQGSTQLLEGGDVFVGWGSKPYYTQYRQDGTIVLDARFDDGVSYRAFRFDWKGAPSEPPAAVLDGSTVFASWNGSTETTHWRVLGRSGRAPSRALATVPRSGFETAVPLPSVPPVLTAQALSASGKVLASARVAAS